MIKFFHKYMVKFCKVSRFYWQREESKKEKILSTKRQRGTIEYTLHIQLYKSFACIAKEKNSYLPSKYKKIC